MTHKAERGLFELKQGRALCVTDAAEGACALVAAVDGLALHRLEQLRSVGGPPRLVVTRHRGHAMGMNTNGNDANLSIGLRASDTLDTILGLATERRADEQGGIEVAERTPLYSGVNRHNLRYVQAKADRSGHWLMDMIFQHVSADWKACNLVAAPYSVGADGPLANLETRRDRVVI